jgi:carbon storage regulator
MLVLTRKVNEEILIGDNIRIKVVDIGAGRIRLGISAPRDVTVLRDEVIRDFDLPAPEAVVTVKDCAVESCASV